MFRQFRAVFSNAFSSFETKLVQTEEERQQDSSSETDHSESETIQAAKIQARAINYQTLIVLLAFLVALLTLLLKHSDRKETKKELHLLERKEEANEEAIAALSEDNDELIKENKKLNSLIVTLTDEMTSLKSAHQRLEYIERNSFFFWKKEPTPQTSEKGVENSDIIKPSI